MTTSTTPSATEDARAAALLDAQDKAAGLFAEIERRGLVRPGVTELELNKEVHGLAGDLYGVRRHWHKRIVRSGPNTLQPYRENPPDRTVEADDILFLDLGPVFAEWEADFGRTYVLGDDPVKHRLQADLEAAWAEGKARFDASPGITGAELFAFVQADAVRRGWEFGGTHAGHLVGEFPHVKITGDDLPCYIAPGNDVPMRTPDPHGRVRHWILEIHLVDRERQIGAFFEQLLTV